MDRSRYNEYNEDTASPAVPGRETKGNAARIAAIILALLLVPLLLAASYLAFSFYNSQMDLIFDHLKGALAGERSSIFITVESASFDKRLKRYTLELGVSYGSPKAEKYPVRFESDSDKVSAQIQSMVMYADELPVAGRFVFQNARIPVFYRMFLSGKRHYEAVPLVAAGDVPAPYRHPGVNGFFQKRAWAGIWGSLLGRIAGVRFAFDNIRIILPVTELSRGDMYIIMLDGSDRMDAKYPFISNIR